MLHQALADGLLVVGQLVRMNVHVPTPELGGFIEPVMALDFESCKL